MSEKKTGDTVCDLSVFSEQERQQHMQSGHDLFRQVEVVKETDQGFAFRLPATSQMIRLIAIFIDGERQCCPFFTFGITVEAYQQGIWLLLEGDSEVKAMIQAEMFDLLPDNVTHADS